MRYVSRFKDGRACHAPEAVGDWIRENVRRHRGDGSATSPTIYSIPNFTRDRGGNRMYVCACALGVMLRGIYGLSADDLSEEKVRVILSHLKLSPDVTRTNVNPNTDTRPRARRRIAARAPVVT